MFVGFMRSGALGEAIERQNTSDEGIIMPSSSWMIGSVALGAFARGGLSGFAEIGRLVLQRTMLRVGLKADIC